MTGKTNKIDLWARKLATDLNDDIANNRTFCIVTYAALGLVAAIMTIMNVITDKGFLTLSTALFTVLCGSNIIIALFGDKMGRIAKNMFAYEVLAMFTFFLVSGNPDGFSAIWICMLPSIGMFFFNRFRGTIICFGMFLIMVFFLWTPLGQSCLMYEYSDVFKMRFPVLFVAFHLLAYLLETLRVAAFREMRDMQQHYRDLSTRDSLTRMYNRQGMYGFIENTPRFHEAQCIGAIMFDIDHFKKVNDTYGHNAGDIVLAEFASIIKSNLNAAVCRWGGEEFVAVFTNNDVVPDKLRELKEKVAAQKFVYEGNEFHVTASIGTAVEYNFDIKNIDALIEKADQALYAAKNQGRNKIVSYHDIAEQKNE